MTNAKLKNERRVYIFAGLLWVTLAVVCVMVGLGVMSAELTAFQRLAAVGGLAGIMGVAMAMYCQFRILEAEISFELRLREALEAQKK